MEKVAPTCHPTRTLKAKGLCSSCYMRQYNQSRYGSQKRQKRTPTCHPDRVHQAKGLCTPCYQKEFRRIHPGYFKKYYSTPEYLEKNRQYSQKPEVKSKYYEKEYGLTYSEWLELFELQGGVCASCLEATATQVDHDHQTGKVRGLLCERCNKGLGCFRDRPDLLRKALDYLTGKS